MVLGASLALSGGGALAGGEDPSGIAAEESGTEPSTSYFETRMPLPPWLGSEAAEVPEWAVDRMPPSPFVRPGLGTSALEGGSGAGYSPVSRPRSSPVRWGPIDFWPRLGYDVTYGSGLLSGPGREEATWVNSITPGLTFALGDHWTLGYAPTLRFYSADGYDDAVNHSATLGWHTSWEEWSFRLNHATAITHDPLIETATQTEQTVHSTELGATWNRGGRGAFDFSLSENIRLPSSFSDSYSWAAQSWYDYAIRPRLKLGVGWGFGYDLMDPGVDMSNQRLNVRISGRLGEKLTYEIGGGGEWRFFYGSDAEASLAPLVNARISYQALRRTFLSIGFSRDVAVSYYGGQYTENSSVQAGVVHSFAERWSVFADGGFRFTTYQQSHKGNSTAREDGTTFARAGVSARITERVSSSLAYSFNGNSSDQSNYSFDSNQVSLQLNWAL